MMRPSGRSAARTSAPLLGSIVIAVLLLAGCGGSGPTPDPAPTLASSAPADGTTGVAVGTDIVLTFSEAMNRASVEGALSISPSVTCTFSWSPNDRVLTCDPNAGLAAGTSYTVTVGTGAQDAGGTALSAAATVGFETASVAGPNVVATDPVNGEAGVALNQNVRVTFSEAMDQASTEPALSLTPGATCDVTWNPASTDLTCDPQADLQASTQYTLTVAGSAESQGGVALGTPFTSTFTTGTTTLGTCTFGTSTFGDCVFGP